MKPFVLAILLAGCAPYPYTYTSDCITFQSEVELDQSRVELYVAKAEELFDGHFGAGMLCQTLMPATIVVRKDKDWVNLFAGDVVGMTDTDHYVELNRNGIAIVHEAIHVHELRTDRAFSTMFHDRWEELGYYRISQDFTSFAEANNWLTP